jgi:HSP20 family molecular chaperone IbpA
MQLFSTCKTTVAQISQSTTDKVKQIYQKTKKEVKQLYSNIDTSKVQPHVNTAMDSIKGFYTELKNSISAPFPAIDVIDTTDEVIVYLDLPGYSVADIHVDLLQKDGTSGLYIHGYRSKNYSGTRVMEERISGEFRRLVNIPVGLSANFKSSFVNGVLELVFRKVLLASTSEEVIRLKIE